MGDVYVALGLSGGTSSDDVTATRDKILTGYTALTTDGNDEPVTGTMPNRGAVAQTLGINGSYTIPAGYHNGSGSVTQSIQVQGGSTITPGPANKTAVASGRYVNGNIIVAGDPRLVAANIKKGVTIFGVTGTAEGYFPTANDLYLRGSNNAGFSGEGTKNSVIRFESGSVYMESSNGNAINPWSIMVYLKASRDLTGYNTLNAEFYVISNKYSDSNVCLSVSSSTGVSESKYVEAWSAKSTYGSNGKTLQLNLNISNINAVRYVRFHCGMSEIYVYRIWLS